MNVDFRVGGSKDLELRFDFPPELEASIREELLRNGRATPTFEYGFYLPDGTLATAVKNSVAIRPKGYIKGTTPPAQAAQFAAAASLDRLDRLLREKILKRVTSKYLRGETLLGRSFQELLLTVATTREVASAAASLPTPAKAAPDDAGPAASMRRVESEEVKGGGGVERSRHDSVTATTTSHTGSNAWSSSSESSSGEGSSELFVSRADFHTLLRQVEIEGDDFDESAVDAIFDLLDRDGDGAVSVARATEWWAGDSGTIAAPIGGTSAGSDGQSTPAK